MADVERKKNALCRNFFRAAYWDISVFRTVSALRI